MKSQISAKSDPIEALKALIPREFSCRAPRYIGPVLRFIPPCLPTLRDRLPHGEGRLYEVKFDGYRMQAHKTRERVTLFTRNGADWASRLPHLAGSLSTCDHHSAPTGLRRDRCRGLLALAGQVHIAQRVEPEVGLVAIPPSLLRASLVIRHLNQPLPMYGDHEPADADEVNGLKGETS